MSMGASSGQCPGDAARQAAAPGGGPAGRNVLRAAAASPGCSRVCSCGVAGNCRQLALATQLAIAAMISALRRAQNKIKDMVAREMAAQLRQHVAEQARAAASAVVDERPYQEQVEQRLRDQIATFRDEVEKVLAAKRAGEQDVARRRVELPEVGARVERALFEARDLITEVAGILLAPARHAMPPS